MSGSTSNRHIFIRSGANELYYGRPTHKRLLPYRIPSHRSLDLFGTL